MYMFSRADNLWRLEFFSVRRMSLDSTYGFSRYYLPSDSRRLKKKNWLLILHIQFFGTRPAAGPYPPPSTVPLVFVPFFLHRANQHPYTYSVPRLGILRLNKERMLFVSS